MEVITPSIEVSAPPTDAGRIAITGASGNIGGRVARLLAPSGHPLRLLVRDPRRVPTLGGDGDVDTAVATYADHDAVVRALSGCRTALFVSAAEHPDRVGQHRTFVAAARDAGVEHLVYTSFVGAGPDATFTLARDHGATEEVIRESGVGWTFLRDNLYADFLPLLAGKDGVIRGPAGAGRVAAVAQDDVAAVAAAVLVTPDSHAGQAYDLTGPEALTLDEVAATITAVTGRSVRYVPETIAEAYASRAVFGAPDWQVDAWVSTYTAIAAGELAAVSDAVPAIVGRPALGLADLLRRSMSQPG